jgi:hypothetical protein
MYTYKYTSSFYKIYLLITLAIITVFFKYHVNDVPFFPYSLTS